MTTLDLTGYTMSFTEEFRNLDKVTAWGPCIATKGTDGIWRSGWACHTPWHGDFGDSQFTDIDAVTPHVFPFELWADLLKIHMTKGTDGKWRSGLLSTVDDKGSGFQQAGGYFECRMKVPDVDGVWPAFWLGSMDKADGVQAEVDIIEYYGRTNASYVINTHLWRTVNPYHSGAHFIAVAPGSLTQFRTFGAMVNPGEIIFYLDRVEVCRIASPPEFYAKKLFPMVNLACGSGYSIANMQDCYMAVDYIRVYQKI